MPALDADDAAELAQAFAALADPVRLRLLQPHRREPASVCSCDSIEPLGKSQPTVSHHTKALADAGLIVGEKGGRWVWWSVVPGRARGATDCAVGRLGAAAETLLLAAPSA